MSEVLHLNPGKAECVGQLEALIGAIHRHDVRAYAVAIVHADGGLSYGQSTYGGDEMIALLGVLDVLRLHVGLERREETR